uniref:Uncharacterized protein n=1 Tax=Arundo donax TaxID=35708 RepID=A0A0A9HLW0_ARUDO
MLDYHFSGFSLIHITANKELSLAQLVKGVDVCPDHPGSSSRRVKFGCLLFS